MSPRRRIREASVRSDKSDAVSSVTGRSDSSLSDNKTKTDRAALRSSRATNTIQDEKKTSIRQKGAKNDSTVKKQATKMTHNATETASKKTESEELKTSAAETVTSEASQSIQEENVESVDQVVNSIDETSESANTVIKKFENKISEVSRKSSFRQSSKSSSSVTASSKVSSKVVTSSSSSATSSLSATASSSSATVTEGSIKTSSVSKPAAGVRRAQSMKSESRDKVSAARAKPGQGSAATNNPHSNSNGLSRTGAAKKQHLDTNGKGSSTKMVMGKNRYIYTDYSTVISHRTKIKIITAKG